MQEQGTTFSRGVEVSGIYPLTKAFRLVGNYTYNDTEDPDGDQRARRPRQILNFGFDMLPVDEITIHANLRVVKDVKDNLYPTGQVELDDYNSFSASINWATTNQLDLYLRGENLLDDDYQEANGYNTAKSAVYAGARFHF